MSTFNPTDKIHVEKDDTSVKIRFADDTLGFNTTSDGFSVTNDWNNRHFTLGFDENSILYHVTREDIDDRASGKRSLPPEEFIAEMYGYIRALARPFPEDYFDFDFVGAVDIDEVRGYLADRGVIHDTENGLQVDREKENELKRELDGDDVALGEFYQRVLDPVAFEEAKNEESGENIFVYPTRNEVFVLFFYPDGYIGVTTIHGVVEFATMAGGSQMVDHVLRAMSSE